MITLNGLRISNGYIIPTIPDVLSIYGIPQIIKRVSEFAKSIEEPIYPYGIVISKLQGNSSVHERIEKQLRTNAEKGSTKHPMVFKTQIFQSNDMAAAAEYDPTSTWRQKYGYRGHYDIFYSLAKEIMEVAN